MFKCTQCGYEQEGIPKLCPQCGLDMADSPVAQQSQAEEQVTVPAPVSSQTPEIPDSPAIPEPPKLIYEEEPETRNCSSCGGQIPEGGRFCTLCGAKVEQKVPATVGETATAEAAPTTPSAPPPLSTGPVYQPYEVQPPVPYEVTEKVEPPAPPKKKSGKKTLGIAITATVVLIAAIAAFVWYQVDPGFELSGVGGGDNIVSPARQELADLPMVYIQDKDTLKYRTSSMSRSETVTNAFKVRSDYYDWLTGTYLHYISQDGAYLLYLNDYRTSGYTFEGRGELYLRDLGKISADGETDVGIKIASDVTTEFYISTDNSYVFYITNKNDLYAWDFSESYKLDSDVSGIYDWTDDRIFYYKGDVDDYYTSYFSTRDCYVAPLKNGGREGREKVDTDISDMLDWNDEFTEFLYTKTVSGTSRNDDSVNFDVYHLYLKENRKETLATDVHEVLDVDLSTDRVVYLVQQDADINFEDVIEDDMLEADAVLTEPNVADYPLLESYYDYSWYYDDDVDYDELKEQFELFEQAEKEYSAKKRRDSIREMLNDELDWDNTLDISLYEMYLFSDGESIKIDSDIYVSLSYYDTDAYAYLDDGFTAYMKADLGTMPKIKFSEMEGSYYAYSFDLEEYIQDNLVGELYLCMLDGGTPARMTSADDNVRPKTYTAHLNADGTGMYYQATDLTGGDDTKEEEDFDFDGLEDLDDFDYYSSYLSSYYTGYSDPVGLYYVPLEGDGLGSPRLIDSDIEYFGYGDLYQGKNLYITKGKDDVGDLYVLDGGERERIAYDVSNWSMPQSYNDGETLFVYEDFDTNRYMGTLYRIKDGEKEKLYDSVYEYYYRADDLVYLYCNYRSGKGDLYLYNGQEVVLIDYDVTDIMDPWYHYSYSMKY